MPKKEVVKVCILGSKSSFTSALTHTLKSCLLHIFPESTLNSHVCCEQDFQNLSITDEVSHRQDYNWCGKKLIIEWLDTSGTETFAEMRRMYIKNANGFIITYSMAAHESLNDVRSINDEIQSVKDCEDVPVVLVGTCKKGDEKPREVTTEQGREMANKLKCPFFEVVLHESDQVDSIIHTLLQNVFSNRTEGEKQERDCVVM